MVSPLQACGSVRDVVAGVRGSCRRVRRDADRADVYDDDSRRCVQEEAGDSGAGAATCHLMQERKSLAKYRDLHVTLM